MEQLEQPHVAITSVEDFLALSAVVLGLITLLWSALFSTGVAAFAYLVVFVVVWCWFFYTIVRD